MIQHSGLRVVIAKLEVGICSTVYFSILCPLILLCIANFTMITLNKTYLEIFKVSVAAVGKLNMLQLLEFSASIE